MNFVPHHPQFNASAAQPLARPLVNAPVYNLLIFVVEYGAVVALAVLTGVLYHLAVYKFAGSISFYLQVGILGAAVFTIANAARGDYRLGRILDGKVSPRAIMIHWHGALLCLLAVGFLAQLSVFYSRMWIALFYVFGLLLLVPLRGALTRITLAACRNGIVSAKKIFVVGAEPRVSAFLQRYQPAQLGVEVAGCCFLPLLPGPLSDSRSKWLTRELDTALTQAREADPDAIILLAPWSASDAVRHSAEKFGVLPAELHLGPDRLLEEFSDAELLRIGPISTLQLAASPLGTVQQITKRIMDIVLATTALIVLAPLLALVAVLIKLDSPGPALFWQRRYGYNQRTFWIAKFRSMRVAEDGPNVLQARRADDRVTRLGRWLRRWNIDELPQLFNVLKGDMSLVGPRPHALSHNLEYEKTIRRYARRHNVKPGITGWAQVHGYRGETDDARMRQRVEYDLYYIEHCSLWLDIKIMARTLFSPTSYRNAY
ncbi:MAG: undecaprenyl-phosphate glucose phosphotransferase [Hyphomicrobiales bacterium]|nr:undecaprenyl-phosphate glucose phosphotransferase [Hyphomicrobiales bacterium]